MLTLRSLATDAPFAKVSAADTQAALAALLPPVEAPYAARLVDELAIRRRSLTASMPRLARLTSVDERNAHYAALAVPLAERAARAALAGAGVDASAIGTLLVTSSTGHMLPTLDAHLAPRLGLAPSARRLALNGLGCAGAVRAMGVAADLGAAAGTALVVAVDLCSLWLQSGELSPEDVRSNAVFGDGAGAAVLSADGRGPRLLAHRAVQWPDSLAARGATLTSSGYRHFTSPRLARVVARHLRATVDEFLAAQGTTRAGLEFCAVNPSELSLARAIVDHLDLPATAAAVATEVWQEHGNTLAVGPLHVLRTLQEQAPPRAGGLGLVVVLGPGITCDLLLLRWGDGLPVAHHREDAAALA
jgi:alkylresorcinol/alkylpyrone synthase